MRDTHAYAQLNALSISKFVSYTLACEDSPKLSDAFAIDKHNAMNPLNGV